MPYKVFLHPAFALFWGARLFTTIATLTQGVAIGWQVYAIARTTRGVEESAFLVGMVGLVQFLPLFLLALIAGESADRYDRRRILIGCAVVQMTGAVALAVLALQPVPSLPFLFAVAASFGVARAFAMPAGSALAPSLVPRELLPQAVAMTTLSVQAGMVIGPWLGGVLSALDPFDAYATAAGLYLIAGLLVIALLGMPLAQPMRPSSGSRMALIREGLAYLWSNKIVLGAISLDLFAVFLGGATALLPVFARDILEIGAQGFGLLRSGPAIGSGVVLLLLGLWPIRRHAGPWMLLCVAAFGAATIVFALSRDLWLSMAMLIALGAADAISMFVRQSLVQIVTPDPMRGRVSAVSSLFISASNELGEFESGVAARLAGPIGATILGGVGSILVTALWAVIFPALRRADRLEPPE